MELFGALAEIGRRHGDLVQGGRCNRLHVIFDLDRLAGLTSLLALLADHGLIIRSKLLQLLLCLLGALAAFLCGVALVFFLLDGEFAGKLTCLVRRAVVDRNGVESAPRMLAVQESAGERADLGGRVPPVATVDHAGHGLALFNLGGAAFPASRYSREQLLRVRLLAEEFRKFF